MTMMMFLKAIFFRFEYNLIRFNKFIYSSQQVLKISQKNFNLIFDFSKVFQFGVT